MSDMPHDNAAPDLHPAASGSVDAGPKLRILHVVFSARIAGSERYCIDLANGQAALGHEVHVAGVHGSPVASLLSPDVRFHGFRTPLLRRWRLRRLLARLHIAIGHGHLSPACKALATAPDSVTTIATLHVGYKPQQHARLDGVIAVNHAQLGRLGSYAGQSTLVMNWLPDEVEARAFDLRARLGLPPETRLVGSVGRLHPSKGCDVLLKAFRAAAPQGTALVFAGDGPQRAELEKLAEGDRRIHFLGHSDTVPDFLDNLDLFVSPSHEETAGLAILEAMRAGLPVITTATEGPSEYLRDHPVRFVEPGSVDSLAEALATALAGPGPGDDVAGRKRLCYDLTPFSRTTGVANVLHFYRRVAGLAAP